MVEEVTGRAFLREWDLNRGFNCIQIHTESEGLSQRHIIQVERAANWSQRDPPPIPAVISELCSLICKLCKVVTECKILTLGGMFITKCPPPHNCGFFLCGGSHRIKLCKQKLQPNFGDLENQTKELRFYLYLSSAFNQRRSCWKKYLRKIFAAVM